MKCPKCGGETFVPRNGSRYCANPDCTFIAPGDWTPTDDVKPSTDAIATIRRVAELLAGYRTEMRRGASLHANDIGDDPEQLLAAADTLVRQLADAQEDSTRAFERNGQGLDDDIDTVRYTIGHLKATGHDEQTYIYRDLERVLRNLETVRKRSGLAASSEAPMLCLERFDHVTAPHKISQGITRPQCELPSGHKGPHGFAPNGGGK